MKEEHESASGYLLTSIHLFSSSIGFVEIREVGSSEKFEISAVVGYAKY